VPVETVKEEPAVGLPAGFIPGPILLLGAPGAGKGTQARLLMDAWKVPQISTGDLLRELRKDPVKSASPLGVEVRQLMDSGRLVTDELVQAMVAERLRDPDTGNGYILDGFPRTLAQTEWLDAELARAGGALPVVAVTISVGYTELLRRLTGRRNCPLCGRIYNVYSQPPKQDSVCDLDGTRLVQRPDDAEDVVVHRLKTYETLTAPVIAHYRQSGRFAEVNGELPVDAVTHAVADAIMRLRS
jgi:adenylate kinase